MPTDSVLQLCANCPMTMLPIVACSCVLLHNRALIYLRFLTCTYRLRGLEGVRDVGVACSNHVTPTNSFNRRPLLNKGFLFLYGDFA